MKKNIVAFIPILVIGIVLLSFYNSFTPNPNVYLVGIVSVILVGISGYMVSLILKDRKQG